MSDEQKLDYASIREIVAQALARVEIPDLSGLTDQDIYFAFKEVWKGSHADPVWLLKFKARVSQISGGLVELVDVPEERFRRHTMGPANYLALVRADQPDQLLVLGPYMDPVVFEAER